MKIQIEQIEWHKYPNEKPEVNYPRGFLVTFVYPECENSPWVIEAIYDPRYKEFFLTYKGGAPIPIGCNAIIISWAKMPKGWKEEQE